MPSGPGFGRSLWILSRPQLVPYVLGLVVLGYGWAHWDRALTMREGDRLLFVLLGWWALHAGTLWLNAAVDRDEGEVLMGRSIPVPDGIVPVGYLALALSVGLAAVGHPASGGAAAVCAVLAVLYSHPRTMWKGHAVLGPLTNLVGYGLLSPWAGFALIGLPLDTRTVVAWAFGSLGVLGCYFTAQAFQRDEDAARGYRTLVVTHGPRTTIQVGRALIGVSWAGAVGLALAGWLPTICLACAPLGLWLDRWFAAWVRQPDGGSEAWARGMAKRLLAAGCIALVLTYGEYVRASYAGEPVAGLGTTAGHPPDRPRMPPYALRIWEARRGSPVLARGQRD